MDIKHKIKEDIAGIVEKLGQGLCDPVPYDTAWVARVPQFGNNDVPAFPLSLQWLRDHHLENGSWGFMKPFSAHSTTLNTLAAIIALEQWNNPEDKILIERGVKALWNLADYLPSEKHDLVGFELILPALQKEARKYGLVIPHDHYKIYEEKGAHKLQLILSELKQNGYKNISTWWVNLEILGDNWQIVTNNKELGFSWSMLSKNGSIGLSPSATAYMLRSQRLRGVDVPEAQYYLQEISSLHSGGMPQLSPIDTFELNFSLDFFLKAGIDAKHPLLKPAVSRLSGYWSQQNGLGFSSYLNLPDGDSIAVSLHILHQAGYSVSTELLLKYFNGTHISTYVGESTPAVSVNINALNALRLFQETEGINEVIQKIVTWIDISVFSEKNDKWNISPYYSTSRAVFALIGLKDDLVKNCINFFIKNQNKDGGWGKDEFSTAEETAYVSLALSYGLKHGYSIPKIILETAYNFLSSDFNCTITAPIWIGKVLYCPSLIVKSAILAARYALVKVLELADVKVILQEAQLYCVEVDMKNINSQQSYQGSLLCFSLPEFDIKKYSDQITRVRNCIINGLIELKIIKKSEDIINKLVPEGSFYCLRRELSDEDLITHSFIAMFAFTYDDILDESWQLFRNEPNIINQVSQVFLQILQGEYKDTNMIQSLEFPKFIPLCQLLFDIRSRLVKRQSNIDAVLFEIEKVFCNFFIDVNNRINGSSLSSKEFLEIAKITSCSSLFIVCGFIFQDINLTSFKDYKVFNEFQDCASKVGRLLIDIFSISRDMDKGLHYENYVLIKQVELNLSIEDAFTSAVNLYNKQIIKMCSLKKSMQSDPTYKDNHELFKAISIIENSSQGVMDWSLATKRYQSKTTVTVTKNLLKEVDFQHTMQLFDNKLNRQN